ncbi:MAG: hypothetical protein WC102_11000, partial [Saccharofermentanales bacterium]
MSFSTISAPKVIVFPLKSLDCEREDNPASCSAVVMVKDVSLAEYQLVSGVPFHTDALTVSVIGEIILIIIAKTINTASIFLLVSF